MRPDSIREKAPSEAGEHRRYVTPSKAVRRLIALSDPAQVADLYDARDKVGAIAVTASR